MLFGDKFTSGMQSQGADLPFPTKHGSVQLKTAACIADIATALQIRHALLGFCISGLKHVDSSFLPGFAL